MRSIHAIRMDLSIVNTCLSIVNTCLSSQSAIWNTCLSSQSAIWNTRGFSTSISSTRICKPRIVSFKDHAAPRDVRSNDNPGTGYPSLSFLGHDSTNRGWRNHKSSKSRVRPSKPAICPGKPAHGCRVVRRDITVHTRNRKWRLWCG